MQSDSVASLPQVEQFVSESFLKSLDESLAELLEVRCLSTLFFESSFYTPGSLIYICLFLLS